MTTAAGCERGDVADILAETASVVDAAMNVGRCDDGGRAKEKQKRKLTTRRQRQLTCCASAADGMHSASSHAADKDSTSSCFVVPVLDLVLKSEKNGHVKLAIFPDVSPSR